MKKHYRITAKMLAPLMVRQKRQTGTPHTLDYLPGSTLRGALAATCLRTGKTAASSFFKKLFLDHPVHFCDLLPVPDGESISSVLPLTAISCKREPGFDRHGVFDTLAVMAASRIEKIPPDKASWECPHPGCGEDMKPFGGFWNSNLDCPRKFEPNVIVNRHTGIDRTTGTAATSMFFITQAIAEYYKGADIHDPEFYPQYLSGGIFLDDQEVDLLLTLIGNPVFAGADRTRGFGELSLELRQVADQGAYLPESESIDKWSRIFRKRLKSRMSKAPEKGVYFSVKLESNAILLDQFLRPVSEIDALASLNVEPIAKVTGAKMIHGWHAAMGLSRPDDMATAMGSVFLFRYKGDDINSLTEGLKSLVINGIGVRREQGFGRVSICDPLHIRKEDI